jgi:carboxymethylenebutenolidase
MDETRSTMEASSDFASLHPQHAVRRREFMVTSLAAGFALAVQPVGAQTITTDAAGLTAGEVKVPVSDGEIPAYRALPATGGSFPTVIVVEEVFGVHEHIRDLCRRLAKSGYFAIAPELYARLGDVSKISNLNELLTVVNRAPDTQTMSDLDATAAYAGKSGKADAARLAITGFCRGGRTVCKYAEHSPKLKCGVAWYGPLGGKPTETMPKSVLDEVASLKAPVLGLYGGKDQGIPQSDVEAMRTAAKNAGKVVELVVYPDAEHGFNADYRPSYNKQAAEDGWKRMLAWFKKYGV